MNRGFSILFLIIAIVAAVVAVISLILFFGATALGKGVSSYSRAEQRAQVVQQGPPAVAHMETPEYVRAIYMSQCAASSNSFRRDLLDLIADTEINAIIIDIKDFTGTVSFPRGDDVEDLGGKGWYGTRHEGFHRIVARARCIRHWTYHGVSRSVVHRNLSATCCSE